MGLLIFICKQVCVVIRTKVLVNTCNCYLKTWMQHMTCELYSNTTLWNDVK